MDLAIPPSILTPLIYILLAFVAFNVIKGLFGK